MSAPPQRPSVLGSKRPCMRCVASAFIGLVATAGMLLVTAKAVAAMTAGVAARGRR